MGRHRFLRLQSRCELRRNGPGQFLFVARKDAPEKNENAGAAGVRMMISAPSGHEAAGAEVAAKMEQGRTTFRSKRSLRRADVASKFMRRCGGIFHPISLSSVLRSLPRHRAAAFVMGASTLRPVKHIALLQWPQYPFFAESPSATELECISGIGNSASWFSDKASPLRSGEMAFGVRSEMSKNAPNVSRLYSARYCGNAALNRHFARVGGQIKLILVRKWPWEKVGIVAAVTSAARQLGITGATALEGNARKEQKRELISPGISCVQALYRKTRPETKQDATAVV